VDKGISRGGKPVEVMGLLVGRPDVADPSTIIVSDALPLPAEGFETKVVIDDDSVINHMIELGDSLEASRLDHFCGWYHTHPFDVDADSNMSNCFLSNTDIRCAAIHTHTHPYNSFREY
jgi:COP9 signalosome complex subunit 5